MQIEKIVDCLCRKYKTRDPFELAICQNIEVSFLPLGGIKGYYSRCYRKKNIHINSDLCFDQQKFTCAHELGHAILHPDSNTSFLRENTLFRINKFENEANYFAVILLISDEELLECKEFSIPQIAICFNINEQLIKYRIKKLYE